MINFLCSLTIFAALCTSSQSLGALSILKPLQGGTGIGSVVAGDVGNCLQVSDDSPFTYTFGACSGGGGGGSGIATSGPIANTEVIYATGVGTVDSEADFTYSASLDRLTSVYGSTTAFTAVTGFFTNLFIGVDTIAEYIADTAGAMFSGNTETDITVTYDDTDNTVDFTVDTLPNLTGTLDIDSGGTNASSFTTSGNAVYYNGTSLLTAPLGSAITIPYASSTGISASYASSSSVHSGILNIKNIADGCLNIASGVVGGTGVACGSGGGSVAYIATSSAETQFRLPFWDSTAATPALLNGGDAGFTYTPTTDNLTFAYGSTTGISSSYASSSAFHAGVLNIKNISDGLLEIASGVVQQATAGTDYVVGGTGAANQFTYFTGAGAITGDADFTIDATVGRATLTYASSTGWTSGYASSSIGRFGQLFASNQADGCAQFATGQLTTTGSACGSGGGSASIATSSAETSGRIPFWTSTAATPATLSGGVAGFAWNDAATRLTATYASTTGFSSSYASSTTAFFGRVFLPTKGTAAGSFVAFDPSGELIATTSPSGGTPTAVQTQVASTTGTSANITVSVENGDVINMWGAGQRDISTCNDSNGPSIQLDFRLSNFTATTTYETAIDRANAVSTSPGCSASLIGNFVATTTGTLYVELQRLSGDRASLMVQKIPATLTGAGSSVGGSDGQVQYNNGGFFGGATNLTYEDTTNNVGIGTTSPWGLFSINASDFTKPIFAIATSSGGIYSSILSAFSTTTLMKHTSSLANFINDIGGRIGIFTNNYQGFGGLLDHLTVNGRIRQQGWSQLACEQANAAVGPVSADTANICGGAVFAEDGTATMTAITPTNSGYTYSQLATTLGNDGTGVWLGGSPSGGWLIAATSTPVMEVTARINTVQNATTSNFFIGFTNVIYSGTAIETLPTAGCAFMASSTGANWKAVCRTALATGTYQDTGVASSTVLTGTGAFRKFRIEMDATTARFYIQEPGGNLVLRNTITHSLTTQTLNAGIHYTRGTVAGTYGANPFDFFDLYFAWRKFIPLL